MPNSQSADLRSNDKLPLRRRRKKRARRDLVEPQRTVADYQKLRGALQENILTLLAFDTAAYEKIAPVVRPEHFESSMYRDVAENCFAYYRKYQKAPGEHLPDLLEDKLNGKRASARMYSDLLHALHSFKDEVNKEFVLDQLQSFVAEQSLKRSMIFAAEGIQRHDTLGAADILYDAAERVRSPRSGGILGLDGAIQSFRKFSRTKFKRVRRALGVVLDYPGILQIVGFRGHFKSGLAAYMAVGLSAGSGVFGWHCDRPYRILLVDGELPPATIKRRVRGVIKDLGADRRLVRRNLHILSKNQQLMTAPINLADPDQHDELVQYFCQFDVVFLDSIVMLTSGIDLNEGKGWEAINALCNSCVANGTSIVRLQHLGKDKSRGGIGSSYQEFPVDFVMQLEQVESDSFHGNTTIKVTSTKHRNCAAGDFQPLELTLAKGRDGQLKVRHNVMHQSKTDLMAEEIEELMANGDWPKMDKTAFAKRHGVSRKLVYKAIEKVDEKVGARSLIK